ncbi:MAG: cell envelope integrity protein TolA [Alcanivoracaceae bacterium]|nr:cell envelope integrity protein TolA [Alcanivoracaceae bacterium]
MRDLAPAIGISLLLHLIVIGLIGFTWSSDPALQRTPKIPPHITAVVMEKEKKASKPPAKKPAPKPVTKPQPKPDKKPAQKPAPKPEPKPAPKPKPEPAKPAPKPSFDEPSLAEMLAEEELELEAMKTEVEEAEAEAPAEETGPSDEDLAEIASYEQAIKAAINLRWLRPATLQAHDGLFVDVRIRTLPGGEVIDATVVRSSGYTSLDDSALNAIQRASPLPVPSGSNYEKFRVFTMRMTPDFAKTE